MGEPNILSIPPELQAAIVSYITRPSDLKSLCLTCEQLSAVATEQLYNEVYLDVGRDTRKSGFFAHNHRGHPHVRGFTAFTPSVGPEHSTETYCPSANLAIRLVLQVLPRDRLKRFVTELSIDADTASTLFTRQTMMEDVALGIIKRNTLQLPLLAPNLVAKLQKLVIPFSYGHSSYVPLINPEIRLYGELLASCRHLKHLALCRASNPNDDESALSDQAETLFVQLFRPLESRNAVLSLDELRFEDLDFPTSTRHLTSMVDFGNLQWLSIIGCCNSESLLLDLIIVFGNTVPKLRGLIWHDDMVHDQYSFDLIQQLLRSFSGLEHLSIITEDYRLSGSFDLSCLKTHLGTTRCLRLAQGYLKPVPYGNSDLWNISLPELRLLVQQTPELRKLLLDFPSLSMQDIASGNMADYDEFIVRPILLCDIKQTTLTASSRIRLRLFPGSRSCMCLRGRSHGHVRTRTSASRGGPISKISTP